MPGLAGDDASAPAPSPIDGLLAVGDDALKDPLMAFIMFPPQQQLEMYM